MTPARLPVGVVGVGSLGFHHARILRDLPGVELVGIVDTDVDRAAHVAGELGLRSFAELDELLLRVAAVVIAVPTVRHVEVGLRVLERGVHALIEKPLASTLAEADRLLAAAESGGASLAVGHVERFNAALRACEAFLDEPRFIESHRLAPFGPRGTDVAVVLDLMIHDIDLVLSLIGARVEGVDAIGVPVLTQSVDIANARLSFEGGAVANITASRVSVERMRKIRIFQRSGYISLDLASGTGEFLRLRGPVDFEHGIPEGIGIADLVERVPLVGDGSEPLRAELQSFVDAVREGREPTVSGRAGRDALAVATRIIESMQRSALAPLPA